MSSKRAIKNIMEKEQAEEIDEDRLPPDVCLISPGNVYKLNWDVLVTALLLYSCIATPAQIALWTDLGRSLKIVNYVVDCFFFIDIVIIFNSAAYDDDFEIISDRCTLIT